MSGVESEFIRKVKEDIKVVSNNPLEIISLLCRSYLFVDNDIEKRKIIIEIISFINKDNLSNVVETILDRNIMINNGDLIVSHWIIINNILTSKEYRMIKTGDEYEFEYLNNGKNILLEF